MPHCYALAKGWEQIWQNKDGFIYFKGEPDMNEVNKTLFIPLYGKSQISKMGIILDDPMAEKIWAAEAFPIKGKSKSKWLAYNMAMRARVFDDWTKQQLQQNDDAQVLHIGCGLDSRCKRVRQAYRNWIDCDFPEVISVRRNYYTETKHYKMMALDAADTEGIKQLPDRDTAIVEFGAKASKYKNPVNDVGVTKLYGIDDIGNLLSGLDIRFIKEHSLIPTALVNELKPLDKVFFKLMFNKFLYRKIYRLIELGS